MASPSSDQAKRQRKLARRTSYTPEERKRGLAALILYGGPRKAARRLKEQGLPIPPGTLQYWPSIYADEYAEVYETEIPRLKRILEHEHNELVRKNAELEGKALDAVEKDLEAGELSPQDKINLANKAAISAGIHTQRGAELRGDPTTVIEHRSDAEILRKLKAMGIVVEGEAEEIHDAELEPGQP